MNCYVTDASAYFSDIWDIMELGIEEASRRDFLKPVNAFLMMKSNAIGNKQIGTYLDSVMTLKCEGVNLKIDISDLNFLQCTSNALMADLNEI